MRPTAPPSILTEKDRQEFTVYVQWTPRNSQDKGQKVDNFVEKLRADHFQVPGKEQVGAGYTNGDIRYYSPSAVGMAKYIAQIARPFLGKTPTLIDLSKSGYNADARTIEVWLPAL